MPNSVVIVLGIESTLIMITILFLIQPRVFFGYASTRVRSAAKLGGIFLMCVTFCWSIIVGIILSLNGMMVRI